MILLQKTRLNFQNLIFLLFLTFLRLTNSELPKSKKHNFTHLITGGNVEDNYNLGRFVVSIQLKSYQESRFGWYHFCGGSIISSKKILTAAHCLFKYPGRLYKPYEIVVVVGLRHRFTRTNSTQVKDVASVKSHRAYGRNKTLYGDVGFLILKDEISIDNRHVGIMEITNWPAVINEPCTVVGWGKLFDKGPTSDRLMFVDVEIFNRRACKVRYGSSFTPGMICAGYPKNWERDSCEGDSGGPLICEERIVGIVSWGVGCGRKYLPGVYTDVYYYKAWISKGSGLRPNNLFVFLIFFKFLVVDGLSCQRFSWLLNYSIFRDFCILCQEF